MPCRRNVDTLRRLPEVRLPFEPYERALTTRFGHLLTETGTRIPSSFAADIIGTSKRTVDRWRSQGFIAMDAADAAAIALGLHPGSIWPEWFRVRIEAA